VRGGGNRIGRERRETLGEGEESEGGRGRGVKERWKGERG